MSTGLRYIDEGLAPQTLYTYRVRNILNTGADPYSNESQSQTFSSTTQFPVTDVAMWLRAEDILLGNGQSISNWSDFLVLNQAAVQTNSSSRPQLATNGINGRTAVKFGSGSHFELPAVLTNAISAEIFVVLQSVTNTPATNQGLWRFATNASPSHYPTTNTVIQDAFGSTTNRTLMTPIGDLTVGAIYNVAAESNLWRGRLNGPVRQLLTSNSVAFSGIPWLGRSSQGASEPFAGNIAELIAFRRVLSLNEQKTVRDSLAVRYAVTLELPHIPANLALVRTNTVDYHLSWSALTNSENGLESFFVADRRSDTNTSFLPLASVERTGTAFADVTALPEVNYSFRLRAINDVGETASAALTAPLIDTDGDGIPNYLESVLGTNPNAADSDGDGLPDGWEIQHGLNPLSTTGRDGAAGDFDGDGVSNLSEYQSGGNPGDGVAGEDPSIRLRVFRPN
jgi:hypothetical protein